MAGASRMAHPPPPAPSHSPPSLLLPLPAPAVPRSRPPRPRRRPRGVPPFAPLRVRGGAEAAAPGDAPAPACGGGGAGGDGGGAGRPGPRAAHGAAAGPEPWPAPADGATGARRAASRTAPRLGRRPGWCRRRCGSRTRRRYGCCGPGDRVDVIASANSPSGAGGRRGTRGGQRAPGSRQFPPATGAPSDGGALVVLAVPRATGGGAGGRGRHVPAGGDLC